MRFVAALILALAAAIAPAAAAHDTVYDPPAGTFPFFARSPFLRPLPKHPDVDPRTARWLERTGAAFAPLQFAASPDAVGEDYYTPVYVDNDDAAQPVRARIHCTAPWGRCSAEDVTVALDARDVPEDGGDPRKDSHLAIIDYAHDREIDLWQAHWPPADGVLTASYGGVCALDGDGKTGCAATGSTTPLTLGNARVADLLAALDDPQGSLPYAIATSVKCTDGYTDVVSSSDGHTPGCPPEGARVFLDLDDAQVDATPAPALVKVLLRTLDRDHYGMIITDINGGQNAFYFTLESDATFVAAGRPGPLVTQLIPEIKREAFYDPPYLGVYHLPIPIPGIDLARELKFVDTGRVTR